jgi:uncharacterized membrane protein
MPDETTKAETPREKLAHAARQIDMQASNETARNAAQYAILINGGAATAILSFLSKSPSPASTGALPVAALSQLGNAAACSLVGYAAGVCCAAMSMWCSSQASANYGLRWESFLDDTKTLDYRTTDQKKFLDKGESWVRWHRNSFAASILLFLVSTAIMAWALR